MNLEIYLAIMVMLIAIYGIIISENIIKSIISFNVIQTSLILIFVILASDGNFKIPIIGSKGINMVDPLPHALMITAIVISASITALSLMFAIKIFHYYGTLNWKEISKKDI